MLLTDYSGRGEQDRGGNWKEVGRKGRDGSGPQRSRGCEGLCSGWAPAAERPQLGWEMPAGRQAAAFGSLPF